MIRLELPWLPPSSNMAYVNLPNGHGRRMSDEGKKFLLNTKLHLVRCYRREMLMFKPNRPYAMVLRFHFEEIETKGFTQGKAKNRYKVFDGGNRTKLLEDALKDAGGIDDSQTMWSLWQKVPATPERTVLWVWSLEEEGTPFDGILRDRLQ